ncbi:MAG: type II toxin-antitoxin system HicB family antitoxin [Muribaculum sp.]|nr:type II toxin-antitoxin system HicB family antitoxin [Muribaculum sp.]
MEKSGGKLIYPAIFKPFSDGSGGYVVEFPDLPGCVTEGRNMEEAIEMGMDAACGWILGELEDGEKIPPASEYKDVHTTAEAMVNMLLLDIDSYAEQYGENAVRKNLTIPAWLNSFAEKNNINFSKVLQDALLSMAKSQQV